MAASNSYVNHNSLDYQLGGEDQPNFSGSRIEIGPSTSNENLPIRSPLAASKVVTSRPTGLIISYLVIICISLFVAVLVVAGRPRTVEFRSEKKDKYICRDEICQSYVEDLSSVMKTDVEPCNDFYEYVCGNWSQVHHLNGRLLSTPTQIAQAQVDQRLAEYLSNIRYSKVAIENKDPHEIAAFMFNSCVENFDENQVTDLTTLVQEFNGWPLVGDTFNDTIWDIIFYTFTARKEFNLNIIFDINVLPDPLKAESSVLVISTSSALFQPTIISETTPFYAGPDDGIAQKLKDVITELYPQANNTNMLKDLEDVIELEKKLLALKNGAISKTSEWIIQDPKAKELLVSKLELIKVHVGFPDWVKDPKQLADYYKPKIESSSTYLAISRELLRLNWQRDVLRLTEPYKPDYYWFEPNMLQVNAWYYPNDNSITIPMGILDYPIFPHHSQPNTSNENLPIRSPLAASKVVTSRPTGLIISYLVIICISLFVAVLVVAGRPRTVEFRSEKKDKYICRDEICQSYVEDLSSVMKTDVEPCNDFYEYVCGNWSQVHHLNGRLLSTPTQIAQAQVDQRLAEYLSNIRYSKVAIENKDPHEIAAFMFNSCVENFDENQVTDLTTLVQEFNGWPLVGDTFNDTIWDIIFYTFTARKEFNLNIIFDINVLPDPLKAESSVLVISTSSALFQPTIISETTPFYAGPDDGIAQKLKDVITELYPQANNTNMLKDLEDVIELEKKLLALKNGAISKYNRNYKTLAETISEMKKTLKQLNELIPFKEESAQGSLNWVQVINTLLGNSPSVDENFEIGVEIPTVNETLNVLYRNEIKTVKNWFVYKLLSTLGPRFSAKLRQVFLGTGPKATFCAYEVNSLMHFATADIYDARYWSSKSQKYRDMVLDLANEIKSASTNALVSSSWLDEKSKQTLIEKVENITIKIGFPDWIKDRTKLTTYYDPKYSENSGDNNSTYLDVARWILKLNWPRKVKQLNEKFIREDFWWEKNMINVNAWYYPLDNSITFPIGFLDYPMFAGSSHPRYLIFGMLGSIIGHEIFHSLDPTGIIFDGRGQLMNESAFGERFVPEYEKKLQCLMNQYKATTKREVLTITEDFPDNAAVQFILNAYAESESDVFHDDYLPNNDIFSNKLSKAQMLYISYASYWCEETTEEYDNRVKNDVHSHGRDRVIIPLQNSKSFSKVFKCPVGSNMNPAQKCEIF